MASAKRRKPRKPKASPPSLLQTKLLISNRGALVAKYGAPGATSIVGALTALIAADKKRSITTELVFLDEAASLRAFGATVLKRVADERGTKDAIDDLAKARPSATLVLVGAGDVVTFQHLANPLWSGPSGDDPDQSIPSDLPYACTAKHSSDPKDFIAPTREVSRIPDLFNSNDIAFLLECLDRATNWKPRKAKDYASALVISAAVWTVSTTASSKALFGASTTVKLSPPDGSKWTTTELASRYHFINCHGAPGDPTFYGQQGTTFPAAHEASRITGISDGTIVAAECCYGAELYDPALAPPMGIATKYMVEGAYAFMGSTNVAYGPPGTPNGYADLICKFFIEQVQGGATIGRALLVARQMYVSGSGTLDPVGLKTLAQFVLLGDAVIQPVEAPTKAVSMVPHGMKGGGRIADAVPKVTQSSGGPPTSAVRAEIQAIATRLGRTLSPVQSFEVVDNGPAPKNPRGFAAREAPARERIHVAFARSTAKAKIPGIVTSILLLAREKDCEVDEVTELWAR
jgi:hypothetical protein